eukprot:m.99395 g.99395  ORF g.99395 m.99395 type:complete len:87 (-) comp51439_c0_seq17:37-297(-)
MLSGFASSLEYNVRTPDEQPICFRSTGCKASFIPLDFGFQGLLQRARQLGAVKWHDDRDRMILVLASFKAQIKEAWDALKRATQTT